MQVTTELRRSRIFRLAFCAGILPCIAVRADLIVGAGGGGDFADLQTAIDAARPGDTVLVRAGEYLVCPTLTFRGKALTVRSEAGPDRTILRRCPGPAAETAPPTVTFQDAEGGDSVLEGFTIAGELTDLLEPPSGFYASFEGGGMLFQKGSSPTIRDCVIAGHAAHFGAGIACVDGASPILSGCIIAWNLAFGGGGVYVREASPVLEGCTIRGNLAAPADTGGSGVLVHGGAPGIVRSILAGNGGTCGSVLHADEGAPYLENCLIFGNAWSAIELAADARFVNCTIAGNELLAGPCHGLQQDIFLNCIVWSNGPELSWKHDTRNLSDADPRFVKPGVLEARRSATVLIAGREVRVLDPVVEEPDFHLLSDSPAIDAAARGRLGATPATDFDGIRRPCRALDFGAFEFVARPDRDQDRDGIPDECDGTLFHRGDADGDGGLDLSDPIATLAYLFFGADLDCLEAANTDNNAALDLSDPIALLGYLFLGGPPPAAPGPVGSRCGPDPDDPGSPGDLGCGSYAGC